MTEKKNERLSVRVSEDLKNELEAVAEDMDLTSATLIHSMIKRFVKDHKEHGDRLMWPPRFTYYEAEAKTSQGSPDTNASPASLAG